MNEVDTETECQQEPLFNPLAFMLVDVLSLTRVRIMQDQYSHWVGIVLLTRLQILRLLTPLLWMFLMLMSRSSFVNADFWWFYVFQMKMKSYDFGIGKVVGEMQACNSVSDIIWVDSKHGLVPQLLFHLSHTSKLVVLRFPQHCSTRIQLVLSVWHLEIHATLQRVCHVEPNADNRQGFCQEKANVVF